MMPSVHFLHGTAVCPPPSEWVRHMGNAALTDPAVYRLKLSQPMLCPAQGQEYALMLMRLYQQ